MIVLFLPRKLRSRVRGEPPLERMLNLLIWTLVSMAAFVVAFRATEGSTWLDALWQAWQTTTTVGYGDGPPKTTAGRIAVILVSLASIALLGATFGAMFEYRAHLLGRRRQGQMKNPHRNGYVIVQYPGERRMLEFIRQVRCLNDEREVPVCLVDRHLEELPGTLAALRNVHYVRGSILSPDTYDLADLKNQRTVVIFPPQSSTDEADGTTASVVLQVERYLGAGSQVELLCVLVDEANLPMFEGCRARPVLKSLDVLAVVQEAQDPFSSRVLTELLSNSHGPNPVTWSASGLEGWTWSRFYEHCPRAASSLNATVAPLAVIRNGDALVAPPMDLKIEAGDHVCVISADSVDWDKFKKALLTG